MFRVVFKALQRVILPEKDNFWGLVSQPIIFNAGTLVISPNIHKLSKSGYQFYFNFFPIISSFFFFLALSSTPLENFILKMGSLTIFEILAIFKVYSPSPLPPIKVIKQKWATSSRTYKTNRYLIIILLSNFFLSTFCLKYVG